MTRVEEVTVAPARELGGGVGGVPPSINTACTNPDCPVVGVRRQIWLKQVAVGVVAVPAFLCTRCCWVLPVQLFEETTMAKLHVGRPPTSKHDIPAETAVAPQVVGEPGPELDVPEVAEEAAPVQETAAEPEPGAEASADPEPEADAKPVKKAAKKTAAKKVAGKASAVLEMGGGDG